MTGRPSVLRSAGAVSLATLVSRILGLVRDQVQSFYFGAGAVTDAYVVSFRIPNLLRDLFAEGALSSAFVPTFTAERERRGSAEAWRLANRVLSALLLVLGAVTIVIWLGAPWILRVYVPGFDAEETALAVTMTRILAPFLLAVALAAVAMGVLNTCGRFFLPALAPAWFNVAAILGVITLVPLLPRVGLHPALALAIGAMAGGVLQFLVQVPALRREGFRFRFDWAPADPGLRRMVRLMLPATFGLAATQLNIFVDTSMGSFCEEGAITWLQLAFRLMQLPIGLFGVAIATANLAAVSRDAARGDMDGLRATLATSLRASALLTLPATAGLIALREPIIRILYQHGRFTPYDTSHTAAVLLCYAVGLYAYAVTKVQVPTYYALGDTRWPVICSATAVGLKIAVNLLFLWLLDRRYLYLGLALSTSLAAWTNLAMLSRGLARRLGSLATYRVVPLSVRVAMLAAVVGIASALFHAWFEGAFPGGGSAGEVGRLAAAVGLGVAIAAVGVHFLRVPEAAQILRRLRGGR